MSREGTLKRGMIRRAGGAGAGRRLMRTRGAGGCGTSSGARGRFMMMRTLGNILVVM
jgi:hypothetical protein